MRRITMMAALALLPGCATGPAGHITDASHSVVGRSWHYVRTNIAGGEDEQIYVHRAAADRIEVYKMRNRCARAALVTATIDPLTGVATGFEAATVEPEAGREPYAWLTVDGNRLEARLGTGPDAQRSSATIEKTPWHDYDYDLATLSAALQLRAGSRAPFSFGMTMMWPDESGNWAIHWLGEANATFTAAEPHLGNDSLRFEVQGTAFGEAGGGPLWIDARSGTIVDAQWGRPNHHEYRDFRLRLIAQLPQGEAAWIALLRSHYEACPAEAD